MNDILGTLEELPADFRQDMIRTGVSPLWPSMRDLLPRGQPTAVSSPGFWSYAQIRPLLLRAGELTPIEKAERRVLVLVDPGRGNAPQVTASIYCGMQLLLPGESATGHRHTPSAARIVVEGQGGYTVVNGEKLPMEHGDLILTPGGTWHDHGHEGKEQVVWLDVLDLPLFVYLENSYSEDTPWPRPRKNRPDTSEAEYIQAGVVPSRRLEAERNPYPLLRFQWRRVRDALHKLASLTPRGQAVEVDYVNPETGEPCLPTLGFTAMMLRPGDSIKPPLKSASRVFHVVEGAGISTVSGSRFSWKRGDTFSAPIFSDISHLSVDEIAYLICIHEEPLQQKLGFYEERPRP